VASLCWGSAVALLTVACVVAMALKPRSRPTPRVTEVAVGIFTLGLVVCGSWQFERLARRTETYLRERPALDRKFEVTSAVLWDEVEASYREYRAIPGFDEPKKRLYAYLQRHRDEWSWLRRLRPRPRRKHAKPH